MTSTSPKRSAAARPMTLLIPGTRPAPSTILAFLTRAVARSATASRQIRNEALDYLLHCPGDQPIEGGGFGGAPCPGEPEFAG